MTDKVQSSATNEKSNEYVRRVAEEKYKYGFTTDIHTEVIEKGLNEEVVRIISQKKASRTGCLSSD